MQITLKGLSPAYYRAPLRPFSHQETVLAMCRVIWEMLFEITTTPWFPIFAEKGESWFLLGAFLPCASVIYQYIGIICQIPVKLLT